MFRVKALGWAAFLGSFGMVLGVLGVLGDVFTLYDLEAARDLETVLVVGRHQLLPLIIDKPLAHFVAGHFLALFGLALGLFGVWALVNLIRGRFPRGATVTGALSTLAYLIGVAWQTMLGTAGAAISGLPLASEQAHMAARLTPILVATTSVFYVVAFAAFAILFAQLLADRELRRWLPWLSPLPLHIVGFLTAALLPPAPGIFLQFALGNIFGAIFYIVIAVLLFSGRPRRLVKSS
jgi:hypothetical protein